MEATVPLIQTDVEAQILQLGDSLEAAVEDLRDLAQHRANAEADYKEKYWTGLLRSDRTTVGEREAVAGLYAAKEFREWRLMDGRWAASRDYVRAIQVKIESLRTISANVRAMGG